jgi:[ribosomal protein S18]-alanine N-acetyltransferase
MNLRDFRMGDFEAVYRLDQACFEPGIAYARSELRRFLSLSTAQGIVVEVDGRIVGFAVGYVSVHRLGHVVTLDVAEENRGGGIGSALLTELLRRFAAAFVAEVKLEVDMENEAAIAFYERFGFGRKRRLPDYYGPNRPAWEMRLKIRT